MGNPQDERYPFPGSALHSQFYDRLHAEDAENSTSFTFSTPSAFRSEIRSPALFAGRRSGAGGQQ
jgi:hypothetical protein